MRTTFIIMSVILLLITISISTKVKIKYNLLNNLGHIKVYLFGFILLVSKDIKLVVFIPNQKAKNTLYIKIDLKDDQLYFVKDFAMSMKKKIYIRSLNITSNFGFINAYYTALISGYINVILSLALSKLSTTNRDTFFSKTINTEWENNIVELKMEMIVYFWIFDFIWSIITALYKRRIRRHGKYGQATTN